MHLLLRAAPDDRMKSAFPLLVLLLFAVCTARGADAARKQIVLIAGKKSHGPEGNRMHDYPWSVKLLKVMFEHSNVKENVHVQYFRDGWPTNQQSFLEKADTIVVISDGRDGDQYSEAPYLESEERVAFVGQQMKRGCGL